MALTIYNFLLESVIPQHNGQSQDHLGYIFRLLGKAIIRQNTWLPYSHTIEAIELHFNVTVEVDI
jgi:hypothetical protein